MKKAFTLIEVLIVIGIIGILMAVLAPHVTGGTESARAAKCMANLGNLAKAVHLSGQATGYWPLAGSLETMETVQKSGGKFELKYSQIRGWISWNSSGYTSSKHKSSTTWYTSAYCQDKRNNRRLGELLIEKGSIWPYMSGSMTCYVCPEHVKAMKRDSKPCWSYVMNSEFDWDTAKGEDLPRDGDDHSWRNYFGKDNNVSRADRRLLFAELVWTDYAGATPNFSKSPGMENDCVLQYEEGEVIGFNHKSKRDYVAHVVFADCHTDKLVCPLKGLGMSNLKNLTKWLCRANDIKFDGHKYEENK